MRKEKTLTTSNKWIISLLSFLFSLHALAQSPAKIYITNSQDSLLSQPFISKVCQAVRYHDQDVLGEPLMLEQYILQASGASFNEPETPAKTMKWYKAFGEQIVCPADSNYPAGDLLRQVVLSNYRDFANIIGPKNRLSLFLDHQSVIDGADIYEFINNQLAAIEASHDNRRFEFQQDEEWRNMMFFYFLFSEYKINYDAQLKE